MIEDISLVCNFEDLKWKLCDCLRQPWNHTSFSYNDEEKELDVPWLMCQLQSTNPAIYNSLQQFNSCPFASILRHVGFAHFFVQ